MTETFAELLISEVKKCRMLWDVKDKNYHNRLLRDKEWNKIAEEVGETRETIKAKWKNLRDTFKKELKKTQKCRYTGTWCHFEPMCFLKSVLMPKQTQGNIEFPDDHTQFQEDSLEITTTNDKSSRATSLIESVSDIQYSFIPSSQAQESSIKIEMEGFENSLPEENDPPSRIYTSAKKRKIQQQPSSFEKFLKLEAKKIALLGKKEDDDEDMNFFKSLIPHVKQLSSINKLYFRSQVQNLLARDILKTQSNRSSSTSSYSDPHSSSTGATPTESPIQSPSHNSQFGYFTSTD